MNRKPTALILAMLLAVAAVACDGGSSGTGITTAALGNVASVTTARRFAPAGRRPLTMLARLFRMLEFEGEASALGSLEGIRVTIEGTSIETRTDAEGLFSLSGDFAGPVGMLFELPEGGSSARLVITVPRGGELTVANVHIDAQTGQATSESQHVRFAGLVESTDCGQQAATMVSRQSPNDGNTYTVYLGSASVRDPAGSPVGCMQLASGEAVNVEGQVEDDGEVDARSVEVEDNAGGHSGSSPGSGDEGSHDGVDTGGEDRSGQEDGVTGGEDGSRGGEQGHVNGDGAESSEQGSGSGRA